ncbi:hypothetical protein Q5752_001340 [Cryptotrichosporon argae]
MDPSSQAGPSTVTASPASSASPSASSSATASNSGPTFTVAHISAIAGVAAAVLLVAGLGIYCVRRRRARRRRRSFDLDESPRRSELTRSEAASVLVPPPPAHHEEPFMLGDRPAPRFLRRPQETGLGGGRGRASRASAWTDDTEFDMYAVDGSTVARTLSTVSRPNSEYDLEGDAGTWSGHGAGAGTYVGGGYATPTGTGTWASSGPSASAMYGAAATLTPTPTPTSTWQPSYAMRPPLVVDTKLPSGPSAYPSSSASSQYGYAHAHAPLPSPYHSASSSAPLLRAPSSARSLVRNPSARHPDALSRGPSIGLYAAQGLAQASYPGSTGYAADLRRGPSTSSHDSDHSVFRPNPRFPSPSASGAGDSRDTLPLYASPVRPAIENPFAESELAYAAMMPPHTAPPPPTGLRRGLTIIRHADAGRVLDSPVDDDDDASAEVHLPPAYGDLYTYDGAPRR